MAAARLDQYRNCSTDGLLGLDAQIIAQIRRIAPTALVYVNHPLIKFGQAAHPFLQASAATALYKAIEARAKSVFINSAYRTLPQQERLYTYFQEKRCGILAAAIPGKSNHNTGLAIDIEDAGGWRPFLERQGWDWIGSFDPVHFDYQGTGCKDLCWLSIKAFQQLHNYNTPHDKLKEDGQWGILTHQALKAAPPHGYPKTPDRAAVSEVVRFIQPWKPSLRRGNAGIAVKEAQQALATKGFFPDLVQDGVYGAKTEEAVRLYQSTLGLVPDGTIGLLTWKALTTG